MRTKVGTALHEHLLVRLRDRAAKDKRPLNELLEEAIVRYLEQREREVSGSLVSATAGSYRVDDSQFRAAMDEDFHVGE
jgi:hypothetical protein